MGDLSVYNDLSKFCDNNWLRNIFIASGLIGDDKFSIYDKREIYNIQEEFQNLTMKQGYFKRPNFIIYVDKIIQLFCIGEEDTRNKFNICNITSDGNTFLKMTPGGFKNYIIKNTKNYEYIPSNGINIYFFPFDSSKNKNFEFFSFQQISKDEYLFDNIYGNIKNDDDIQKINNRQIIDIIFNYIIEEYKE